MGITRRIGSALAAASLSAVLVAGGAGIADAAPSAPTLTPAQCATQTQQAIRAIDQRLARTNPREYARRIQQAAANGVQCVRAATRPGTGTPGTGTPGTGTPGTGTPGTGSPDDRPLRTIRCADGTAMTYEDVRNFGVRIECGADSRGTYYTGQGDFTGNIGVSVTCPAGSFQENTGGRPQGAVDGDYYVPQFSGDGRTVSWRFYTGNDTGRNNDFYLSGACVPTRPTT